jgi:membrane protease YdiL (CAAX protease family)
MIVDSISVIFIFGFMSLVAHVIAKRRGFYDWHPVIAPPIEIKHVLCIFAIYVGAIYLLSSYLASLLQKLSATTPSFGILVSMQLVIYILMLAGLYLYCCSNPAVFKKVWINRLGSSPLRDFGIGVAVWLFAFPVVTVVSQFFDLMIYLSFRFENYEQVAVRYLKTTMQTPSLTILALISIVVIAPVVEEFLFRGTLQTYLKRRLGAKNAILLAAACFAFFHYSSEQGLGNLSLIPSLFTFACFLGYIYERQGSLFASIGLHAAFNFVSSLRIIFFPDQ